jgi:uncharacterized protein YbjT (DUF2867 family)
MRVLVTGATGFIGNHLVPRLVEAGHEVRAATRHPDSYDGAGEPVAVDLEDVDSLRAAVDGCDAAHYLVHSLDADDFMARDRRLASNFVEAAGDDLDRVVYLGGLGARGEGSDHLQSRHEVGDLLADHLPTVELRASMVLGAGSASYELLRQIVERVPRVPGGAVPGPVALATRTQPVDVDSAVAHLVAALELPPGRYDIGAADAVTFAELMEAQARATGTSLHIEPVLPAEPEAFAPVAALLTDQEGLTIRALFASASTETVVDADHRADLLGVEPVTVAAILERLADGAG